MKHIIIEINAAGTFALTGKIVNVTRMVVRSDKIVGLAETADGFVKLITKASDDAVPRTFVVDNSFDEIADFIINA
ncbi:hypothetical protein CkP1_0151 [Citrobacter phage CkP1]|nr:hypothetical protein CkP1_0151 [Citrobacter phage CkP1]